MISLLFTVFIAVLVLTIKEMAAKPEKTFPEAATDGVVTFFSELKVVLSGAIAKFKEKKIDSGSKEKETEKPVKEEVAEEEAAEVKPAESAKD